MKTFKISAWILTLVWLAVLPALADTEKPNKGATDEIRELREKLAEQTKRLDRIYNAIGPELEKIEERAAEAKKEAEEDAALKLETIKVFSNEGLSDYARFSPVENVFAVVTSKGTVQIYTVEGKKLHELSVSNERLTAIGYAPDGKQLLTGTQSGKAFLWDLATEKSRLVFTKLEKQVCHVFWVSNPDRVLAAYENALGEYAGFIVGLGQPETSVNFTSRWQVCNYQTIAVSGDGKLVGVIDIPGQKRGGFVLDSEHCQIKARLFNEDYSTGPLSIGIAPDNNTVAIGFAPYHLSIWDAKEKKELRLVKAHSNWVTALGFSPDSNRLISGAGDRSARIWEVSTGKEIGRIRFEGPSTYVNSVGFSMDGKYVLAASDDKLVIAKAPAH